jgi:hypothetical protein
MFWKSKKPFKKEVKIKHVSGEYVTITLEGSNESHVEYMAKRIKSIFIPSENKNFPHDEFNKVFEAMDDVMKTFDNVFKNKGK